MNDYSLLKKLTMERNTKTILEQLNAGDRFYKAGDPSKTVWEVMEKHLFKTVIGNPNIADKYRELTSKKVNNTIEVIYLRNKQD